MSEDRGAVFWMVWNDNGRAPTKRHETEKAAEKEAQRLAGANPGQSFYVLQAIAGYIKVDIHRIVLDYPTPF